MTPGNDDDWGTWSKYVLKELERLNECYDGLNTTNKAEHDAIIKEISKLESRLSLAEYKVYVICAGIASLITFVGNFLSK